MFILKEKRSYTRAGVTLLGGGGARSVRASLLLVTSSFKMIQDSQDKDKFLIVCSTVYPYLMCF